MKNKIISDSQLYLFLSLGVVFINFFLIDYVDQKSLIFILAFFVIFCGLPHGALDTLYAKKNNLYSNFLGLIFFNFIYLFLAIITFFLWQKLPVLFLSLFLLISIFHFSEDWKSEINIFQRLLIATSVISFIVLFKKSEVELIFFSLTNSYQSNYIILFFYYLSFILVPLIFGIIFLNFKNKQILLNIITIIFTAILLNPLMYFLCYFCFFHSIKNFKESKILLFPQKRLMQQKILIINLLLTLILSIIILRFFLTGTVEDKLLKIIFIGLASLTVPHMLLKTYINYKIK